jgi:hypothetical protein
MLVTHQGITATARIRTAMSSTVYWLYRRHSIMQKVAVYDTDIGQTSRNVRSYVQGENQPHTIRYPSSTNGSSKNALTRKTDGASSSGTVKCRASDSTTVPWASVNHPAGT